MAHLCVENGTGRGWSLGGPIAALLALAFVAGEAPALTFADGLVHVIDGGGPFEVDVRDGAGGAPTRVEVVSGDFDDFEIHGRSAGLIEDGNLMGPTSIDEDSALEVRGGTVRRLFVDGNARVTIEDGTLPSTQRLGGGIPAGFYPALTASGSSFVDIRGGSIAGGFGAALIIDENASVVVSGGLISGGTSIGDATRLTVTGGQIDNVSLHDRATLTVLGGLLIDFSAGDASRVEILGSDGRISSSFGGSARGVIRGGELDSIFTQGDSLVRIVGSSFSLPYGPVDGPLFTVVDGTLQDGTAVTFVVDRPGGTIVLVPEPTPLLALALGLAVLCLGRRPPRT